MWIVKTKVIPLTTQATGTIPKSHRKYLSNIPGKHEIKAYKNSNISHCTHTSKILLQSTKRIKRLTWETALHVPYIVTTEQL
jgi:hypothetical protein